PAPQDQDSSDPADQADDATAPGGTVDTPTPPPVADNTDDSDAADDGDLDAPVTSQPPANDDAAADAQANAPADPPPLPPDAAPPAPLGDADLAPQTPAAPQPSDVDIVEVVDETAPESNDGTAQLNAIVDDAIGVISSQVVATIDAFDAEAERLVVDLSDFMNGDSVVAARLVELPEIGFTNLVVISEDALGVLREGIVRIGALDVDPDDIELIGGAT
ncbi:MAG: hypothetical protein ACU0DW_00590, partial [Shimia sp.]